MIPIFSHNNRHVNSWRLFQFAFLLGLAVLGPGRCLAHQTPTTIVLLDISPDKVGMELQIPLSELELAFGQPVTKSPETLIRQLGPQLKEYLQAHIHPFVDKEHPWMLEFGNMRMDKGQQAASGPPYWELVVHLMLKPPPGVSTRKFILDYDVIMHQVINHAAIVSIRNDWETGKAGGQPAEAGVIHRDMKDNVIYPFEINLEKGSWWKGCKGMIGLGMSHIREGTDHLLFLLVLLLPATLLLQGKRWGRFAGTRNSLTKLLKIVTAFTIGHSITLLIGALGWVHMPAQPIEVLIAISILVSAVHAIYPVFPGKEIYIAAGFGLVHGMAFASVLANLNLDAGPMALSIFGFNLGIELMQLLVIVLIVPWLILLSQTSYYTWIRIPGAVFAGIAACGWTVERVTGEENLIGAVMQNATTLAPYAILALASLSIGFYFGETFYNSVRRFFSK